MEVYTSASPFLPPGTEAGNIGPLCRRPSGHPINPGLRGRTHLATYMLSMDNAVDVWRLTTASQLPEDECERVKVLC